MAVLKIKDGNNWIEITGLTGAQGPQGVQGPAGTNGTNGTNGTTPVKGTDYWTSSDIADIESDLQTYINTQLGVIENGTY